MKSTILAVITVSAFLATACGGGSSSVSLHGTFTDTEYNSGSISPLPSTCAEWEADNLSGNYSSWQVSVKVDNVDAGSADINWTGKPHAANALNSVEKLLTCTGSWSITVAPAHISYSLLVSGVSGSTIVQPGQAGQPIGLSSSSGVPFP